MKKTTYNTQTQNDLDGLFQLSQDGIVGVVGIVEAMQQRIYSLGGLFNKGDIDRTNGFTGLIYNSIRKTTELSFKGVDFGLMLFRPLLPNLQSQRYKIRRNQMVSVLNGVLGDHLAATNNPLSIEMSLTYEGQEIAPKQAAQICSKQKGNALLLIHGLCMNDEMWQRNVTNSSQSVYDHGNELMLSKGFTPIYLKYNSGLAIHENGDKLDKILKDFAKYLPANKSLNFLCHSMGGLVARSAINKVSEKSAKKIQDDTDWMNKIGRLVFLGTPHQGAALEKAGNIFQLLIESTPYSVPFAKLTSIRSQGIKDLREGRISKDNKFNKLPENIDAFSIATSSKISSNNFHNKIVGDGLVSINSALGNHENEEKSLNIPPQNQIIVDGVDHIEQLSDLKVLDHLKFIFK